MALKRRTLPLLLLALSLAVVSALAVTSPAQANGYMEECAEFGGTWSESDATHATCVFPPGSPAYISLVFGNECEADASQIVFHYLAIEGSWNYGGDFECIYGNVGGGGAGGGGVGAPPYGPYGNEVTDPVETTLCLTNPKNGCVTFVGDQHVHKCTISPMLPAGPDSNLPNGVDSTLYVRLPGDQGADTHTVCFNTEGIENPVLYQYIAGEWVIVAAGGYGGQICTTHTGDGSFAMGSQ